MGRKAEVTVTRRACLLGVLLAPFAGPLAAIGIGQERREVDEALTVMGGFNAVPTHKDNVSWMLCQGWKLSDKNFDRHGKFRGCSSGGNYFLMERTECNSEVKPDHEDEN